MLGPKYKAPSSGCAVMNNTFCAFRTAWGTKRGSLARMFPSSKYSRTGKRREIVRMNEMMGMRRRAARRVKCVAAARRGLYVAIVGAES